MGNLPMRSVLLAMGLVGMGATPSRLSEPEILDPPPLTDGDRARIERAKAKRRRKAVPPTTKETER